MRRSLYVAAAAAVVAAAGATLWGVSVANAADDSSSSLVEDYSYPGAAAWEQQVPGLQLFSGDGHIIFKGKCTSTQTAGMLVVESDITGSVDVRLCFQVLSSTSGYLSLKVPAASYVDGDGTHQIVASVQPDEPGSQVQKTNIEVSGFTPIGISTGNENTGALIELRVGWDPSLPTP